MRPSTLPTTSILGSPGRTSTIAHAKCAVLLSAGTSRSSAKSFALFAASSCPSPANLAEYTPGAPFRASTQRPESSASTASCGQSFAVSSAFLRALPMNESASSSTSSSMPASLIETISSNLSPSISLISRILFLLFDAIISLIIQSSSSNAFLFFRLFFGTTFGSFRQSKCSVTYCMYPSNPSRSRA